ncbi:MAG TPA: circularly permuted type 2 ATP-grasp protein [Candidatus Dormibacteraeota bacterium]|nr:circularly permuted type 2 ATP-grasp protein [Candidatus Dormibacteraeota bacterium]
MVKAKLALPESADECVDARGDARKPYRGVLDAITADPGGLARIARATQEWFKERGITFGIPADGSAPIFPFDPIPRVLSHSEWGTIHRAISQRAMALDHFVSDCYGSQRALRNGVVPARLVYSSTGYLRDIVGVRPPRATWCHVAGIDVVRIDGAFHVLEDNVRVPSGVAYALEARLALENLAPQWFDESKVRRIDAYTKRLCDILQRIAPRPWEADIVVLTPGSYNAAYYEHRMLAERMGATLVEGHQLIVSEDEVYRLDGEGEVHRVDVIYSRVTCEWIDPLVFRRESLLGAPGMIEAWRRGHVAIANAPGTGVADDKAIYPYVPAMIRYYLGEEPLFDNVPTYDLSDAVQLEHVVTNLDAMVLKPVDASGGYGIHFGRLMSETERETFGETIRAAPRQWLAQEEVELSRAVCLRPDGKLDARAVDLRPFVLLDERPWIFPGGLTRVAANSEELVVNSSQGGGSKDTWVLSR